MAKKWTKEIFNRKSDDGIRIAEELIENIREQDRIDVLASGADLVFEICACLQDCETSYVYRGENGELLCIMGKSKYIPEAVGRCIYMLGTNALLDFDYQKQLLVKEAHSVIREWVNKHGVLFNAVNSTNYKSIRWLKGLGAIFVPEGVQVDDNVFYQFIITKGSVK